MFKKNYKDTNTALQELRRQIVRVKKERCEGKTVRKESAHRYILESQRERWTDREEEARTKSSSKMTRKRWRDREIEG